MKILDHWRNLYRKFRPYQPLVEVLINESKLFHNLNEHQKVFPDLQFAPVLKSNAYGHGLSEVAKILDNQRLAFFMVDSLYEAKVLRGQGVRTKVLVSGYTTPGNILGSKLKNISFTIVGLDHLVEISKLPPSQNIYQLKLDTGMHRQGIRLEQLSKALTILRAANLKIEGVFSHLADADNIDPGFTLQQIELWNNSVQQLKKDLPSLRYFHLSASAGVYHSTKIEANLVRLGLGLYGLNRSPLGRLNLKPVLSMNSIITSVKPLKKGESIGYGATYTAQTDMLVATVPVGYYEGVDRRLSNGGFFKVGDKFCPIVGRVSMNMTSLDVSSVPSVRAGQPVNVISDQTEDLNSINGMAKICQTISHEILIHIPAHLRRSVI